MGEGGGVREGKEREKEKEKEKEKGKEKETFLEVFMTKDSMKHFNNTSTFTIRNSIEDLY